MAEQSVAIITGGGGFDMHMNGSIRRWTLIDGRKYVWWTHVLFDRARWDQWGMWR